MPGMAVTAREIREGLAKLRIQKELTDSNRAVLERFEQALNELEFNSPAYPYRQSLTLCYRFLHYKSLLDYQEQVRAFFPDGLECLDIHKNKDTLKKKFEDEGVSRWSFYKPGTTLEDLEALPWHSLLDKTDAFESALSSYYYSIFLHRELKDSSGFRAFQPDIPLIPCSHSLGVDFFNKTVSIPLWLVGFSLAESTRGDGFDMGCSEFLDHDLYHLAIKLMRFFRSPDGHQVLSDWIRQLYQHRDKIPPTLFAAIELCIFYVCHEQGLPGEAIMVTLKAMTNVNSTHHNIEFNDLPSFFAGVTTGDVRQACRWLMAFPVKHYSDRAFREQLGKVNAQSDWVSDPDDLKEFTIEQPANQALEAIRESIKNNWSLLKESQLQPRRVIEVLNLYEKKVRNSRKPQTIDLTRLLNVPRKYEEEACWLYCYFQAMQVAAKPVQQACERFQRIKANAQKLSLLSKKGVEAFANECLRRHPEYNNNPALVHIAFNGLTKCIIDKYSFIYNDIFQEDYSDFWSTQNPAEKKERMDYPVGYMGKFENNQLSLWWFSHKNRDMKEASQLYEDKEKEGHIKGAFWIMGKWWE